jgi:hypothetical protein
VEGKKGRNVDTNQYNLIFFFSFSYNGENIAVDVWVFYELGNGLDCQVGSAGWMWTRKEPMGHPDISSVTTMMRGVKATLDSAAKFKYQVTKFEPAEAIRFPVSDRSQDSRIIRLRPISRLLNRPSIIWSWAEVRRKD